jgi:hypothetical protein
MTLISAFFEGWNESAWQGALVSDNRYAQLDRLAVKILHCKSFHNSYHLGQVFDA